MASDPTAGGAPAETPVETSDTNLDFPRPETAEDWQRLVEEGRFESITDLAVALDVERSYVSRMLRLTLLAPDIVEAILAGR